MSADFFSEIDNKLQAIRDGQAVSKEAASSNLAFLKELIIRLTPVVLKYENELKSRGINVKANISQLAISFSLHYKDGGHHSIILGSAIRSSMPHRIEITNEFTNDDGKNYHSTDGSSYDESNWKDEIFEEKLKKCIKDFLFYAERHQGI